MTGNLIATTSKISMHPLAFQGILAYTSFPQIRDMLLRKFGDEYVLLFARPVENPGDGQIDWYSPVQGDAYPLDSLSENERMQICNQLSLMAAEISKFAEELIQSQDPLKVTRGHVLKLALCYPDDSAIYVIGKQPVFTCWGFEPGTPGVESKNLMRMANVKTSSLKQEESPIVPPISEEPTTPPKEDTDNKNNFSLLWLLPLIPLLLLFLLLFGSFGSLDSLSGRTLFHWPILDHIVTDKKSTVTALEAEVITLQSNVEQYIALCVPPKKPASLPDQPTVIKPEDTKPKQDLIILENIPDQPPVVKPEGTKPKQDLVIPENAHDTTFLKGRWLCDTGLYNTRTNEPVKVSVFFDDDGKGEATIYEKKDICKGQAKASLNKGELQIELDELHCSKSKTIYSSISITCENGESKTTSCRGLNNSNGDTWEAIFIKIR